MKMDDAKTGFGLKWVKWLAGAMLVPALGVPANKLAESYYKESFVNSTLEATGVWLATLNRLFENDIYVRIFALMVLLMAIAAVAIPMMMSASVRRKRIAPYVSPFTPDEEAVLVAIGKMTRRSPALESQRIGKLTGLSVESAQQALKKLDHLKFTYSSYNRRGKALIELTPKGRGQFLKLAPFATLEIVPKC
ncbi:hypothetical protein [Pseudomonas sp. VI4.1]|uniref:hypothetical protein n=1 Tax=Pseudomonas sp. VI4.1 TaxID=1941346 RepID=UPI0009C44EC9|nr:hypothetical protein [Pseudomonas sp. VI4.1]OPK11868.1 hypothetical protein BZ163_01705 [Pseudomonas sp. VI4.1]